MPVHSESRTPVIHLPKQLKQVDEQTLIDSFLLDIL